MANASPPTSTSPATIETHRVAESNAPKSANSYKEDLGIGRWYAGLHVGAVIAPDLEIRGPGLEIDSRHDTGFLFDAVFGYKFKAGFRLEGEFSYRNNDTNSILDVPAKVILDEGIGGTEAITAMLNAWYDIDILSRSWSPYFGAGFGYTKVWIDPGYWGFINVIDSSDSGLAWQAGAGLLFNYTRDLQISIDYRYLRTVFELEFHDFRYSGTSDAVYQTHSIMLGFRGFF